MEPIKLGGHTILPKPPDPATCAAVVAHYDDNRTFAACAALGLCWPGKPGRNGKPDVTLYRYRLLDYGKDVFNALFNDGHNAIAIQTAAIQAWSACHAQIITAEEVEAAEDFSKAPAGTGEQPSQPAGSMETPATSTA